MHPHNISMLGTRVVQTARSTQVHQTHMHPHNISMLPPSSNVSLHAEGGHYATQLEPPSSFEAHNYMRAASIALQEGQNGMGMPLVNADGALLPIFMGDDFSSFMGEDLYGSFDDLDASIVVNDHMTSGQPNSLVPIYNVVQATRSPTARVAGPTISTSNGA